MIIIPMPRDATSVATMIGLFPVLNSFRTQSRSACCLSPWIANARLVWSSSEVMDQATYRAPASRPGEGTS